MSLYRFIRGATHYPAVILAHGLLGSSRNLMRLSEKIAALGFYTITYDQRGHGHSPHFQAQTVSFETLAGELWSLADELKIEKAHLIGHSMGGRVCMVAAALRPERVLSLSMLDVAPKISEPAVRGLHRVIDPLPSSFASKKEAETFLAESIHLPEKEKIMFEKFLLSNLRDQDGRFTWMFDLNGIRERLLPLIGIDQHAVWEKIKNPLLIVRGGNSGHFSQKELDLMLKMNTSALKATVADAGHWIHVDNLEGTFKVLKEFLI